MPNICEFNLSITGKREDLETFHSTHQPLSFETDVPLESTATKDASNEWGTKWDLMEETNGDLYETEHGLILDYCSETAWGPPLEWLEKMSIKYPTLIFTLGYCEPGMRIGGTAVAELGVLTNNELTDEEFIVKEIEDYGNMDCVFPFDDLTDEQRDAIEEKMKETGYEEIEAYMYEFYENGSDSIREMVIKIIVDDDNRDELLEHFVNHILSEE